MERQQLGRFTPVANAYPGCFLPVIYTDSHGHRCARAMKWGLVPKGAKPGPRGDFDYFRMFNARVETVSTKPVFKRLLSRQRCVLPADAFYEWKLDARKEKQPYAVSRSSGAPLLLAGVFDVWRGDVPARAQANPVAARIAAAAAAVGGREEHEEDEVVMLGGDAPDAAGDDGDVALADAAGGGDDDDDDTRVLYTFSLLTSAPVDDLTWLHTRMPVILDEHDANVWLDSRVSFESMLTGTLLHEAIGGPHGRGTFQYHPCSKVMNSLRYQEADAGVPITREEMERSPAKRFGHTGPTLDTLFKRASAVAAVGEGTAGKRARDEATGAAAAAAAVSPRKAARLADGATAATAVEIE